MSNTVIVDDTDPSITWLAFHWDVNRFPGEALGDSAHLSTILGATMSYTFTGTQISVYGIIAVEDNPHTVAAFSVDGTHHREFRAQYDPTRIQWRALLYSSPTLDGPGPHTLQVTNLREDARLWIDYFMVQQPSQPPASSSPPSLPPSQSAPSPGPINSSTSPSSPPNSIGSPNQPSSSPSSSNPLPNSSSNASLGGVGPSGTPSNSSEGTQGGNSLLSGPTIYLPGDGSRPSPSSQGSALDASGGSSTNAQAGMIAGVAVGAVAAVAMIVLLVILLLRRRRSRRAPSDAFLGNVRASMQEIGNHRDSNILNDTQRTPYPSASKPGGGEHSESKQALNPGAQMSQTSSRTNIGAEPIRGSWNRPPSYLTEVS